MLKGLFLCEKRRGLVYLLNVRHPGGRQEVGGSGTGAKRGAGVDGGRWCEQERGQMNNAMDRAAEPLAGAG